MVNNIINIFLLNLFFSVKHFYRYLLICTQWFTFFIDKLYYLLESKKNKSKQKIKIYPFLKYA